MPLDALTIVLGGVLCLVAAVVAFQLSDPAARPALARARRMAAALGMAAAAAAVVAAGLHLGLPWWSALTAAIATLVLWLPALAVVAFSGSVVLALEILAVVVLAGGLLAAQLRDDARDRADWRSFERAFWQHVDSRVT